MSAHTIQHRHTVRDRHRHSDAELIRIQMFMKRRFTMMKTERERQIDIFVKSDRDTYTQLCSDLKERKRSRRSIGKKRREKEEIVIKYLFIL